MTTIAVKIDEAVWNEHGPINGFLAKMGAEIPADAWGPERANDDPEPPYELSRFGFYFGMAYALARIEEPWASEDTWVRTAKEAAIKAHRWGNTIGGRPEGES